MANTIGASIVLEGEAAYREAIKNINSSQKEMRSEMQLVNSQFIENENSLEALKEKHEVLAKQVEVQTEKVSIYAKAVEESTSKQEKEKENLEALTKEYAKAETELEALEKNSSATTKELEDQQKTVAELKGKLELATSAYSKTERSTNSWQTSLNYAQTDLNKLDNELQKNETYLDEASASADACATSIDKYGKEVKSAGDESEDFGVKSKEAINTLAAVIVASGVKEGLETIAETLQECSDISGEIETAYKTASVLFGDVQVDVQNLQSEVRTLSKDGTDATEIYTTMYQAMSAGIDATEDMGNVVAATDTAIKGAIVGLTDSASTMDLLTTIQNSYNMEADTSQEIMDQLITTQNMGKTTLNELTSSMGKTVSTATAYNISLENVNSGYISLTKNGIATSEAGTYMTSMFSELGDEGSSVAKILTEKTGKSLGELMADGYSMADVLEILYESCNNNSEALMNMWSSQEAGKASNAIISQGIETFNDNILELTDSAGTLEDAYETMTDTAEMAEARLTQSATNFKQVVGDQLNVSLKETYEVGTDILNWATEFVDKNPEVVSGVIAITSATAILTLGLTGLATVNLPAVTGAVTALTTAMMANPAGILAVGLASLTAAAITYVATCPTQETEVQKVSSSFKELKIQIEEADKAYEEASEGIKSETAAVEQQIKALLELTTSEQKTVTQKKQISQMVSELNTSMTGLNLSYDESVDALSMTNEQLEAYADNISEQKTYQTDVEEMNRLLVEQQEIQEQLTEAQELYNKQVEAKKNMDETSIAHQTTDAYIELCAGIESSEKNLEGLNLALTENQEKYETLEGTCSEYTGTLDDNAASMQNVMDVSVEYNGVMYTIKDSTQEVADQIALLEEVYEEAAEAAYESITSQVGLFDELVTQSEYTVGQMSDNLQSQTDSFQQYTDDLNTATALMNTNSDPNFKAIIENIASMGIDGAGYLHELVTAAQEDSASFNEVLADFGQMEEAKEQLADTLGAITSGYTEGMEEYLSIQTEMNEERILAEETAAQEVKEIVSKSNEEILADTTATVTEMNTAIASEIPTLKETMTTLTNEMISSTNVALGRVEGETPVFYQMGIGITEELADGIEAGSPNVASAVNKLVNDAVNSVDISGIAQKLDQAIGEALY